MSDVDVSVPWAAIYAFRCASCGQTAHEGTMARYVDGEAMHDECAVGASRYEERRK